jgi:hypothetical protein
MGAIKVILYIDTETGPSTRPDVVAHIAGKHYDPSDLEGSAKDAAKALEKTSLSGTFGELWVVSIALDDNEPITFVRDKEDPDGEAVMLRRFARDMIDLDHDVTFSRNLDAVVAHIVDFDRHMIRQRCTAHGIYLHTAISACSPDGTSMTPWDRANRWRCTMALWTGDARGRISLGDLALALAVDAPTKGADGITGDQVWPLICAGHLDRVASYCADDVRRVRAIYQRIMSARRPDL